MKKPIVKVIIVILVIMLVGVAIAFVTDKNSDDITTTTTTAKTTVADSKVESTSNDIAPEETTKQEETTSTTTKVYESSITVNQALNSLQAQYKDYDVNATVTEGNIQYFSIVDKNSGEKYASVAVNLDNAKATATIMATQEKSTFNLYG